MYQRTQNMERSRSAVTHDAERTNNLWKLLLISAITYLIWNDIKISEMIALDSAASADFEASEGVVKQDKAAFVLFGSKKKTAPNYGVEMPRSAKGPLTFAMDSGFAQRYEVPEHELAEAKEIINAYIERYAPVAVAEMQEFGIPASITLAQGLLESNIGSSRLATSSRNHFGIKCFSRTCKKGHCVNFTDDTHKDFFVKFKSVWESYRAHSKLLRSNARYKPLFRLDAADYQAWATGLSKHGYATDPKYAQKLIAIIRSLGLDRYDG